MQNLLINAISLSDVINSVDKPGHGYDFLNYMKLKTILQGATID